ncbi:hypothetical protein V8F20_004381 [Naviculisporaceae sp. PSN 640]
MKVPKFLGALVIPLALSIPFFSSRARAAIPSAANANAAASLQAANLTAAAAPTVEQAKAIEVAIQWWRFNPNVDHQCQLSVMAYDNWSENAQARYRVIAQANPGTLPEQTKDADPQLFGNVHIDEMRRWFQKDMLGTWKTAWLLANKRNSHIGQNPQIWLDYKEKAGHWVAYGDLSQFSTKIGWKEYVQVNVASTRLWSDWTLNRCAVLKDF